GEMYVVTGDCAGRMYLIRGRDGEIINVQQIGANFESSPVVVGNSLVVGSRGKSIYKITLK
ncbi:MAG: dehydrogenase, partial [Paramuribaculum sp.]|nr:dehydrogenase [Paramuribaculum sp.]